MPQIVNLSHHATNLIESALQKGGRLHGFRSGGGLRVFNIDSGAYGESATADEALRILADDIEARGRSYFEVYGKTEKHYLTGQSESTSELDAHLLHGNTIDVWIEDGQFVAELSGWGESRLPPELHARALAGESLVWTDTARGVTYQCTPIRFANGEPGYTKRVASRPPEMLAHRTSMWGMKQRGVGDSFLESIAAAFAAEAVEVAD